MAGHSVGLPNRAVPLQWEICPNPQHCNHKAHGSLRRVVGLLYGILERIRIEEPAKYDELVQAARTRIAEREAKLSAGGS